MEIEIVYIDENLEPVDISPDTELAIEAYSVTLRRWTSRDSIMESLLIKFKVGAPI